MSADLIHLVQRLGQPRVLVVGDLMLDRYVWGDAERISQEAPVILLHADKREERLGSRTTEVPARRPFPGPVLQHRLLPTGEAPPGPPRSAALARLLLPGRSA